MEQAERLVHLDPRRPKQANLRRAISSAYYALFHLLVAEGVRAFVPGTGPSARSLRVILARVFEHHAMVGAAQAFAGRGSSGWTSAVGAIPPELVGVAKSFVTLQGLRHAADYDLGRRFSRSASLAAVADCERAFIAWEKIRKRPAARAFLLALLFKARR